MPWSATTTTVASSQTPVVLQVVEHLTEGDVGGAGLEGVALEADQLAPRTRRPPLLVLPRRHGWQQPRVPGRDEPRGVRQHHVHEVQRGCGADRQPVLDQPRRLRAGISLGRGGPVPALEGVGPLRRGRARRLLRRSDVQAVAEAAPCVVDGRQVFAHGRGQRPVAEHDQRVLERLAQGLSRAGRAGVARDRGRSPARSAPPGPRSPAAPAGCAGSARRWASLAARAPCPSSAPAPPAPSGCGGCSRCGTRSSRRPGAAKAGNRSALIVPSVRIRVGSGSSSNTITTTGPGGVGTDTVPSASPPTSPAEQVAHGAEDEEAPEEEELGGGHVAEQEATGPTAHQAAGEQRPPATVATERGAVAVDLQAPDGDVAEQRPECRHEGGVHDATEPRVRHPRERRTRRRGPPTGPRRP